MELSARSILKVLSLTTAFIATLFLAYLARHELIWIGTAFFLAVALNPAVEGLSKVMPRRNRGLATGSVFILLLLFVVFLGVLFVPPLVSQSQSLADNLPHYTDQLIHGHGFVSDQIRHYNLVDRIKDSQNQVGHYISGASGSLFGFLRGLFSSFAAGITILGLTFFMLLEGPGWIQTFWRSVPAKRRAHGQLLAGKMYRAVTGYVNGNLLTSLIAAVTTAIVLAIVHVPYAIPLGIFVGVIDLLPLVGATIGAVVVILTALFTSVTAAIVMVIFYLIYQQLENHVLQPIVYGRTVEMSPLLVLVAVIIGVPIGGLIGAIVAIPVFASLQILIRDYSERRLAKTK